MRPRTQVRNILPDDYIPFAKNEVEDSIVDRFRRIVLRYSDRVAVEDGDQKTTYHALDLASNILANRILADLGGESEPIPLLYGSAAASYVAQLAVLKSGKFFASLDPALPLPKLRTILDALEPRLLLTDAESYPLGLFLANEFPAMRVMDSSSDVLSGDESMPYLPLDGSAVAYVTYTSGSTGDPQGVVILHRNVLHSTMNHTNNMHLRHVDRASQICAIGSAASASETYAILLNGGTLLPYSVASSGSRRFADWLKRKRITVYTSVPTTFRLLLDVVEEDECFPDVRLVRLSGDRVLGSDVERFKKHFGDRCLLRICLGAAECFLYTQLYVSRECATDREVIPAGYPLDDMEVLVVDDEQKPLNISEQGEIAVKSKYLTAGYWKNKTLTSARFIDVEGEPGMRMYLTQDVGYLEKDGCLVHVGRKDFNVKIYGKMVSIGEVERIALEIPDIKEAVVVPVVNELSETTLKLYYVASPNVPLGSRRIREHLLKKLAGEKVPQTFVALDRMPLTQNQKIDRKALAKL